MIAREAAPDEPFSVANNLCAPLAAGLRPARQPSCVCFGGPDLDLLYVTSAREGLDAAALHADPNAGDVFVYRTGTRGVSESEYRS